MPEAAVNPEGAIQWLRNCAEMRAGGSPSTDA